MAIDWTRNVQACISVSSMESEIIGQSKGSSRALVIVYLGDQRGWVLIPFIKFCDNQSGIRVVKESQLYSRSAHIRRHYFHQRGMLDSPRLMIMSFVPTDDMLGDYQTKFGLSTKKLHKFLIIFMALDFL